MTADRRALVHVFLLTIVPAGILVLNPSPARGGPRDHADGFFLRLSGGGGFARSSIDLPGGELELDGGSGDINFAVGAMVNENFALHGTLFGWLISDPDAELDGSSGTAEGDLDLTGVGGGLTYYFMPANVYLSTTLGLGIISFEDAETDPGLALDVSLGKEWWVGNRWGLGVAGFGGFHSIPDGDIDENWSGTSFGLRFSATMN